MKSSKDKQIDMLHGSIWDKLLLFALPLALSSIIQQLFNSADVAVVGRFAGSLALAAVGANSSVINLLVNLFVGLSVGANVVIARYIGQGNMKKASDAVHTSILVAILSGFILMGIGLIFAHPILEWMSTPEDILPLAVLYLKIYFCGMPFIMLYNFTSAILRSQGDTKRPLYALILSGIVNVLLNLFFVVELHMSVEGVAIATVVSNIISSMILLIYLIKKSGPLQVHIHKIHLHPYILKQMASIGVPAGLQGMVFSISNVMVQTTTNGLGSIAVAASSAALNYEYFAYFILSAFTQSAVTFVGQNYGAGNYERCRKITRTVLLLGMFCTQFVSILFILFKEPLISIFTTDPKVIEVAYIRLVTIVTLEFLNAYTDILSGALRGLGHSSAPAIVCILGICGVRIGYILFIYPMVQTFQFLMYVYPISWIITAVALSITYFSIRKKVYKM